MITITLTRVSALGKDPSQEATIVEKILNLDESSSSVKEMWLKWRENRGVTGLRPPPGGPMAPTNVMSTSLRKAPVGTKHQCSVVTSSTCAIYWSTAHNFTMIISLFMYIYTM